MAHHNISHQERIRRLITANDNRNKPPAWKGILTVYGIWIAILILILLISMMHHHGGSEIPFTRCC